MQQPVHARRTHDVVLSTLDSLISEGREQEALNYLETHLLHAPVSGAMLMYKVQLLMLVNRFDEALECVDAVLEKEKKALCLSCVQPVDLYDAYLHKAALLEHFKRYHEAVSVYEEARVLGEQDPMLHSCIGRLLASHLKRYGEALSAFHRALEHASEKPKCIEEVPFAYHLLNKANALSQLSRYQEAITVYRQAMQHQALPLPLFSVIVYNLACTFALREQYREALSSYQTLLLRDPTFVLAYAAQAEVEARLGHSRRASVLYARLSRLLAGKDLALLHEKQGSLLDYRLYIPACFQRRRPFGC